MWKAVSITVKKYATYYAHGKRSTCTSSVYCRKSIWPVSVGQLTCINKQATGRVTKFNVSLYFFISILAVNRRMSYAVAMNMDNADTSITWKNRGSLQILGTKQHLLRAWDRCKWEVLLKIKLTPYGKQRRKKAFAPWLTTRKKVLAPWHSIIFIMFFTMGQNILNCGKSYSFIGTVFKKLLRLIVFALVAARGVRIVLVHFYRCNCISMTVCYFSEKYSSNCIFFCKYLLTGFKIVKKSIRPMDGDCEKSIRPML